MIVSILRVNTVVFKCLIKRTLKFYANSESFNNQKLSFDIHQETRYVRLHPASIHKVDRLADIDRSPKTTREQNGDADFTCFYGEVTDNERCGEK